MVNLYRILSLEPHPLKLIYLIGILLPRLNVPVLLPRPPYRPHLTLTTIFKKLFLLNLNPRTLSPSFLLLLDTIVRLSSSRTSMMNGMTSMIRTDMTTSILEKDCTRTRIKVGNCVLFSSQQFKYKINLVFDF